MAKKTDPTFEDHLNMLVKAKFHSSYEKQKPTKHALLLVQLIASQFVDSGVLDALPPAITVNSYNRIEENKRQIGHEVHSLQEYASSLAQLAEQMKREPPDAQNRQSNQDQFSVLANRFIDSASPFLAAFQNRAVESTRKELDDLLTEVREAREETLSIRDTAKQAAGEVGAGHHAGTFSELAESYRWRARVSLGITVVVAVVLIAAVIGVYYLALTLEDLSQVQIIQVSLAKLVGLSVLYFLLVLAARAYKANAHLYAVNQHRTSALRSFETFVKSAADDQTKSAVLLETTRCIYSHVPSGYLGSESPSSPVQMIEVLKAASD